MANPQFPQALPRCACPGSESRWPWCIRINLSPVHNVSGWLLSQELAYNPFMRVDKREIQEKVGAPIGDEIQTMHLLRSLKNNFKG